MTAGDTTPGDGQERSDTKWTKYTADVAAGAEVPPAVRLALEEAYPDAHAKAEVLEVGEGTVRFRVVAQADSTDANVRALLGLDPAQAEALAEALAEAANGARMDALEGEA